MGANLKVDERDSDRTNKRRLLALLRPLALAGLLAGLLLAVLWTAALAQLEGGKEVPIYTSSNDDSLPDMAASRNGQYLALAWSRGYEQYSGASGYIFLSTAKIADGYWQRARRIYPSAASETNAAREARIVFDPRSAYESRLHLVWNQKTGGAYNRILYAAYDVVSNATIGPSQVISASNGPEQPDVAVDSAGRVHVVWVNRSKQVLYACYNGSSWGSPIEIATGVYTVTQPAVAFASGTIHIVWAENTLDGALDKFNMIRYRNADVSANCASSFANAAFFSAGGSYEARNPKVAAAINTVYVVWDIRTNVQSGNVMTYYLVYNRSINGGSAWDPYRDIPTTSSSSFTARPVYDNREPYDYNYGEWLHPDVTLQVSGAAVIAHVAWQESTLVDEDDNGSIDTGYFDIFYSSYSGTGQWTPPVNVTAGPDRTINLFAVMPSLAMDSSERAHLAYMKETVENENPFPGVENWDIYYRGVLKGPPTCFLPIILKNKS